MRRMCAVVAFSVALVYVTGSSEAWAQRMATTTMVARPDFAQFQAAAFEWLRATITSGQFIFGAALGVVLAEAGRFLWRCSMKTLGVLHGALGFILHHRLIVAALVAVSYYATIYWVLI